VSAENGRTPDAIRRELRAERAQLDSALESLGDDVRQSSRRVASALAGLAGLLLLRRLFARRR